MNNRPSYYAVIPATVRYDDELSMGARMLYGELTALSNDKGYCWATNSYFSKLYRVGKSTISRWISELESNCYIRLHYSKENDSFNKRYIYITDKLTIINGISIQPKDDNLIRDREPFGISKNSTTLFQKNGEGIPKMDEGYSKKSKENSTTNNTVNIVSKKEETTEISLKTFNQILEEYTDNQELQTELKNHLKVRKLKKGALTDRALELSLKKLDELTSSDSEKIEIVQRSIQNGWIGFFELPSKKASKSISINCGETNLSELEKKERQKKLYNLNRQLKEEAKETSKIDYSKLEF